MSTLLSCVSWWSCAVVCVLVVVRRRVIVRVVCMCTHTRARQLCFHHDPCAINGPLSPFMHRVRMRVRAQEVRYIIDFYNAAAPPGDPRPIAMHLDVRPALDSFTAAWDRVRRYWGFFSTDS